MKIVKNDDWTKIVVEENPAKPEKSHVAMIQFPGGDINLVRTTDNKYWVHIRINHNKHTGYNPEDNEARIVKARLDQTDKSGSEANLGDFGREELYHLAVLVETV